MLLLYLVSNSIKILFFPEIRIHKFFYDTQTKQAANNSVYFIKYEKNKKKMSNLNGMKSLRKLTRLQSILLNG